MKLSSQKFQLALVLFLAAVLAGVVALIYSAQTPSFYFEVSMSSSTAGTGQIFYDIGRDISEQDSMRLPVGSGESSAAYRFPLPEAEYHILRFDPLDRGPSDIVISYVRIVDTLGRTVRDFLPSEIAAAHDISHLEVTGRKMKLTLGSADNDSQLVMRPSSPIRLHATLFTRLFASRTFLLYFLPLTMLGTIWVTLSFFKRPLKRPLVWAVTVFAACLTYCVWAGAIGWNDAVAGFRNTQTAITCFYMLHQPLALAYQTPVLGPPWAVPIEFPLYQWIVASLVNLFGTPLDQTGRLVSFFFFLLTLVPTYLLLGTLRVARPHRLLFLSVIAVSPFYIFWARDFMIETTALCLSVAYLASAVLYAERRAKSLIVLACICGTLAVLVKITTFAIFVIPVALFLTKDLFQRPLRLPRWSVIRQRFALLVLSIGVPLAVGLWWTHFADRVKEQNPIGHYLTSSHMMPWIFGSVGATGQRLSVDTWHTILARTPLLLTHHYAFWIACLFALILTRRRWKEVGICLMLYLAVPLVFTNLYFVHEYYMCGNGIFLLGAVGFCIVSILETPGGQKAGFAAALVAVVLAAADHRSVYAPRQRENNHALASHVKELFKNTESDSVIIFLGFDWSPAWPYYAERRALMIPDWGTITESDMRKALANLRGYKIAGVIANTNREPEHHPYPLDSLIKNMKALGLDTNNVRLVNK